MFNPKFSIIIPVYNVAPYLRECLDSVLAQTFTDWEAICVDDGSTDGSGAILDEYAAKDARFRVIHQANAGVSAARNAALDMAKGEWMGFVDGDDWLDRLRFEHVSKFIRGDIDWIATGCCDYVDTSPRLSGQRDVLLTSIFESNAASKVWEQVSVVSFPFINFIRRTVVGSVKFVNGVRFREDALFLYEVALDSCGYVKIDDCGYFRRVRAGSATFSPRLDDDHVRLMGAFEKVCELAARKGLWCNSLRSAATRWFLKDLIQWYMYCPTRTLGRSWLGWRIAKRLVKAGFLKRRIEGSLSLRIRWLLYLLTGMGRVLIISRTNLFGGVKWQM